MFLSTRVYFRICARRKEDLFYYRACTQKENLSCWATFFFFLFFILAKRVLFSFFPARDQANWNIKSAFIR